jgi:hypothetical protein
MFEAGEIGSRSYKLDQLPNFSSGEHCIRFYYYLSDEYSKIVNQIRIQQFLQLLQVLKIDGIK